MKPALALSLFRPLVISIVLASLVACTEPSTTQVPSPQAKPVTLDDTVTIVAGQTVYVPIYSHIYTWEQNRRMNLTATLSVRNTDLNHPLIIASVDYYDTNGTLVRSYLEQPVELGPISSQEFVVEQEDVSGGSGATFLVEWVAQMPVSTPVIEAVMINAGGNQGISFISPGRVIKTIEN